MTTQKCSRHPSLSFTDMKCCCGSTCSAASADLSDGAFVCGLSWLHTHAIGRAREGEARFIVTVTYWADHAMQTKLVLKYICECTLCTALGVTPFSRSPPHQPSNPSYPSQSVGVTTAWFNSVLLTPSTLTGMTSKTPRGLQLAWLPAPW